MKDYIVTFYYHTDQRTNWQGQATNELHALALALGHYGIEDWCEEAGFRIEISQP
jgi:hypothetical protein